MGIKKHNTPGCDCCPCLIGDGTMDYTVCSGTWSEPATGQLRTSSSGAKIIFDTDLSSGVWRFTTSWSVSSITTAEFSVWGGIDDPGTGYCNGTGVHLDVFAHFGIGNSSWTLHDASTTSYFAADPADCNCTNVMLQVAQIGYDGSLVTSGGHNDLSENGGGLTTTTTFSGTRFGISTGTLTGGGHITFHTIKLERCPPQYRGCCNGPNPATISMAISGATGTMTSLLEPACTAPCSRVDGTYVMSECQNTGTPCQHDGVCFWRKKATIVFDCPGPTTRNETFTFEVLKGGLSGRPHCQVSGDGPDFGFTGSFQSVPCTGTHTASITPTGACSGYSVTVTF